MSLLTIPPELLLKIISHLPTPTTASLHALTLTSRGLSTFIHTHAALICNTAILTHYPLQSLLLSSHLITSTLDSQNWLVPSHPSMNSIERWRVSNDQLRFGRFEEETRLTEGGPQFLLFLEEYCGEIGVRFLLARRDLEFFYGRNVLPENEVIERASREGGFEFSVRKYAVEPFVRRLEEFSQALNEFEDHAEEQQMEVKKEKRFSKVKAFVGKKVESMKLKRVDSAKEEMGEKRALLFGEIERTEDIPIVKDGFAKRLLWYYGVSASIAQTPGSIPEVESEKATKCDGLRRRLGLVKEKAKKTGRCIRRALRKLRCGGSLDDSD
ncbi:hypothetical protein B0J14DRAFT_295190 [Halenospora varia]|nr:hypothetical protein B0J14DRAFT_295190 [Halenospora varia]